VTAQRQVDFQQVEDSDGSPPAHLAFAGWLLVTIGIGLTVVAAIMLLVNAIS
jgi:hypothetical protein